MIYHILFSKYFKAFTYEIVHIILVYEKSQNDIQKLVKNVSIFFFIFIIFIQNILKLIFYI